MTQADPAAAPGDWRASRGRRRLAFLICIFAAFYLTFDVYMYITRGLFLFVGVDYRSFWTSALIAHTHGFGQVYDLNLQTQIQESLVRAFANPDRELKWATAPTVYLPAFVIAFLPFLVFPPGPGFAVWTAFNVVATLGYLVYFWRWCGGTQRRAILLMTCLCFPALENFQFGQVNGWLMIFMGEFFRRSIQKQDLSAGAWLAGMLLKPQTLMIMVPGLALARQWRMLAGAIAGGTGLLVLSFIVGGFDGLLEDAKLVFLFSGNLPSTVPRDMMNWRSLAYHLSDVLPAGVAWGFSMVGLAVTLLAGLWLWLQRDVRTSDVRFALVVLGSYAATSATAWHSHTHMGLPMAIPILYLAARDALSTRTMAVWVLTPYLVFAILRVVLDLGHVGVLAANLYLLGWAIVRLRESETATSLSAKIVAPVPS